MAKTSTSTQVGGEVPPADEGTAALAARRRAGRTPATTAAPPGDTPASVGGQTPVTVLASRTLVAAIRAGEGGPGRPTGGVWLGEPLVLSTAPSRYQGVVAHDPRYVVAECDAEEAIIAPGCYTPTSRTLWSAGQLVRRDLYESVLAAHATSTDPAAVSPAALPEGVTDLPAEVIAAPAP